MPAERRTFSDLAHPRRKLSLISPDNARGEAYFLRLREQVSFEAPVELLIMPAERRTFSDL